MTRLLFDVNASPLWLHFFSRHGIDGQLWVEIGDKGAADRQIMEYARENGFAIFTYDLDFGILLAKYGFELPSVIQIRSQSASPQTHGPAILKILNECGEELDNGLLITVLNNKFRCRKLPIESLKAKTEF